MCSPYLNLPGLLCWVSSVLFCHWVVIRQPPNFPTNRSWLQFRAENWIFRYVHWKLNFELWTRKSNMYAYYRKCECSTYYSKVYISRKYSYGESRVLPVLILRTSWISQRNFKILYNSIMWTVNRLVDPEALLVSIPVRLASYLPYSSM